MMKHTDLQELGSRASSLPRNTTLFHETGLRTLLLHLKAGERIPEHQTRGAILVHCLAGEGAFSQGEERAALRPGILLSVGQSMPHSVNADPDKDLLLLVIVSEQATNAQ